MQGGHAGFGDECRVQPPARQGQWSQDTRRYILGGRAPRLLAAGMEARTLSPAGARRQYEKSQSQVLRDVRDVRDVRDAGGMVKAPLACSASDSE